MKVVISNCEEKIVCIKIDIEQFDFETLQEAKKIITDTIDGIKDEVVVLDLSSLEFMDSMGLSLIITAYRYAKEHHCKLKLAALSKQPSQLVDLLGLNQLLEMLECEACQLDTKKERH
ncbi:MAG: STAS domain-containing protein [Campylobacterales bacterium]|nr:STAS domain-containing protein [Campylobacterales bacterium]